MMSLEQIVYENKKAGTDKMITYDFSDKSVDCQLILRINAKLNRVKKLLNIYRKNDEDYNTLDWIDFLKQKGYKVEIIEIDHELFF